jgi:hypothetical protein
MSRMTLAIWSATAMIVALAERESRAVSVSEPSLGISFTLPDGFERLRDEEDQADFVRVYRKLVVGEPIAYIVGVERLGGVLPRTDVQQAPKDGPVKFSVGRWKDFDVIVGQVSEELNGAPATVFNVQIPLKPEAVQLKFIGPASRAAELRSLVDETLLTLKGDTNWLSAEERWERLATGARRLGITVGVVALIAAWLVYIVRRVRRFS